MDAHTHAHMNINTQTCRHITPPLGPPCTVTLYVSVSVYVCVCLCGSAKCRVLIAHVRLRTIPLNSHFSHSSTDLPCLINWLSVLEVPLKRDMSATESFSLPQKNTMFFPNMTQHFFLLTGHTHFHNGQS